MSATLSATRGVAIPVRSTQIPSIEELKSRSQHSFSTLWDGYSTDAAAKAARNECYLRLKRIGVKSTRSVLKNQIKKYESFGIPDGRSCDVYYLNVQRPTQE